MTSAARSHKIIQTMIHIVFNEPDVTVIQQAIEMEPAMAGDVMLIRDDYAVGPLADIYVGEGRQARKEWWREVLTGGDYENLVDKEGYDDYETIAEIVGRMRMKSEEQVWIWAAQNKHDVCGYYWLLHFMKEFQGRVQILYLNNLPFINEKGNIFYPVNLHEIPAKEFLKARKLAREITLSEFEVDPDEWQRICSEGKMVRLLEGGKKLVQADEDFFDNDLKKFVMADWQKASKIIHQFLAKAKHTTGDAYLLWRLKKMVALDMFDVQGKVAHMKDFEIKWKA